MYQFKKPEGWIVYPSLPTSPSVRDEMLGTCHFLCISVDGLKLLGVHYRPRKNIGSIVFKSELRRMLLTFHPHVVFGDFIVNIDCSTWLTSLFTELQYDNALREPATRECTQIDGVFTKNVFVVVAVLESLFSHHRPIGIYIEK